MSKHEDRPELTEEELQAEAGEELPEREAMSRTWLRQSTRPSR